MILSWKGAAAALAFAFAAAAAPLAAQADEALSPVTRILGGAVADLKIMPDGEPQRVLVVTAEVPTGGWTNGQLHPVTYVTFPTDGIWDVEAVGQKPDGMAMQMISKLVLAMDAGNEPGGLKGYRIHAAENCVVVLVDKKAELPNEKCVVLGMQEE